MCATRYPKSGDTIIFRNIPENAHLIEVEFEKFYTVIVEAFSGDLYFIDSKGESNWAGMSVYSDGICEVVEPPS